MSPVFTQEFVPDTQSQSSSLASSPKTQGVVETGRIVRASFTALGLALSLGATGSLISNAEAADSTQLAALPSVTGAPGTLPSFGSTRPEGASATYHTVADGETIWDIAKRHGVTVEDIKAANGIGEAQVIQAGQVLKVPSTAPTTASVPQPSVVLEIPQEIAATNSSGFMLPDLDASSIDERQLEVLQAEPLTLSEFLAEQRQVSNVDKVAMSAASEERVASAGSNARSMSVVGNGEVETLAALPTAESVSAFSEQLQSPAKFDLKRDRTAASSEGVLPVFQGDSLTHRVGSGETVWSIARTYGVEPEVLQTANGIDDPHFIVAGDELVIPVDAALAITPDPDVERLARRQISAEQQMAAITPVIEKKVDIPSEDEGVGSEISLEALTASLESRVFEPQAPTVAISDPFVEGMLSEVASATQSQVNATAATAERYSSQVTESIAVDEQSAHSLESLLAETSPEQEVAVNPQFADGTEAEFVDVDTPAFPAEDLLAAAPLGSEVYAPVIESPEGRLVSPEMPVLPGQEEYLPEAPNRFNGYIWPAQGVLTSGYGWRWGRMHQGVDIAGPVGTPIYAAGPGVVVKSGWNSGGYGNMVDIRHPDGSMTRYAHNSRLLVSEGQQVRQGQQIAEMGSTGYSTGPHLHFEIHIPNQGTVNPIALLPSR